MSTPDRSPLEFYFDFLSPFGYFASLRVDALAARHRREIVWKPMLLGISVLKVMKLQPILDTPLKGSYIRQEATRYMRRHRLTLRRELKTPTMNPLPVARLFAWLSVHAHPYAKPFAKAAYHAYWQEEMDICTPETLAPLARTIGLPENVFAEAIADPQASQLLRRAIDAGLELGVFGSPFFRIDGEPFFGCDKLELIDDWLTQDGW